MNRPLAMHTRRGRAPRRARHAGRRGAVLVWFALLLTLLMGMLGLVVDGGLLMSGRRQAQNAADAAALAAAMDLMHARSVEVAEATAIAFVQEHNGLAEADVEVLIPPNSGPHAGLQDYVEVIVSHPSQTFFIHILNGGAAEQMVRARAVAGFEAVSAGEGVAVLDPHATPGLRVMNNARLVVDGRVIVNSEGGGVDENGNDVDGDQLAADGGNPGDGNGVYARDIRVVGGVNRPDSFRNYDHPDDTTNVLFCRQSPIVDPLKDLPVPTTDTGVLNVNRGTVSAAGGGTNFNDPSGRNKVEDGITYLYPGIYESIEITGGHVIFEPGIYVLAPKKNTTTTLKITGGTVTAEGIMFYNTGNSYSAESGAPDTNDGEQPPPKHMSDLEDDTLYWGGFTINAGMRFTPINTLEHAYLNDAGEPVSAEISDFNGMLFYQRRRNNRSLDIQGNAADGQLMGTLYAKWARVSISGQGTYNAQFVVGRMELTGQADVTLQYAGQALGRAPRVFLVE